QRYRVAPESAVRMRDGHTAARAPVPEIPRIGDNGPTRIAMERTAPIKGDILPRCSGRQVRCGPCNRLVVVNFNGSRGGPRGTQAVRDDQLNRSFRLMRLRV